MVAFIMHTHTQKVLKSINISVVLVHKEKKLQQMKGWKKAKQSDKIHRGRGL